MTPNETEIDKRVKQALDLLREHCDSATILVTVHDADGNSTKSHRNGFGNWFARVGLAREWIKEDEARTLANELKPPPDSADEWKN